MTTVLLYAAVAIWPLSVIAVGVFYCWDLHRYPDPALVEDREVAELDYLWEIS